MKKLLIFVLLVFLIPAVNGINASSLNASAVSTTHGDIVIFESDYDPAPAEPGRYVTLWVSIQNWGDKDITDAYFRILPEYPFYLDPWDNGIKHLGIIGTFREKLLEFKLKIDEGATEGDNTIDIIMCSDSKCQSEWKRYTLTLNVNTGGSPDLLTLLEDSDVFMPGSSGEVSIGLINKGKLDIKFLTITLLPDDNYEILSPNQLYIGELDSDDSDSADFKIFLDKSEGSSIIKLPLKIEYSDGNYKKYTETKNIDLRVYSSVDARKMGLVQTGSSIYSIIAFIMFVGVAYFGYRWWKKKKDKHHKP